MRQPKIETRATIKDNILLTVITGADLKEWAHLELPFGVSSEPDQQPIGTVASVPIMCSLDQIYEQFHAILPHNAGESSLRLHHGIHFGVGRERLCSLGITPRNNDAFRATRSSYHRAVITTHLLSLECGAAYSWLSNSPQQTFRLKQHSSSCIDKIVSSALP